MACDGGQIRKKTNSKKRLPPRRRLNQSLHASKTSLYLFPFGINLLHSKHLEKAFLDFS